MKYLEEIRTKFIWWFLCKFLWVNFAFAQNANEEIIYAQQLEKSFDVTDSIWMLEGVQIEAKRLEQFSTGSQVFTIDSAQISQQQALSLGELLASTTPIFIKAYGSGSLSTSTIRGMSASHTAILWNGMPIQSPMNGQLDFSLLPANMVDRAALQLGGEGALWGSGAVGGTLYLQNEAQFNSGIQADIAQTFGSFGRHFQSYSLSRGTKDWFVSAKVFRSKAKNDFPFLNRAKFRNPTENLEQSAFRQRGIMLENYIKINQKQQLAFRFWGQDNEREIPATLTESRSEATQDDGFIRMLLTWTGYQDRFDWKVQSGYTDEELLFKDPDIRLESLSESKTWINEAEANWQLNKNLALQGGVQHQYLVGSNANYSNQSQSQHRSSIMASFKYQTENNILTARASVRQEFSEFGNAPLVPTLGVEFHPFNPIRLQAKVTRSYRLPTFNDLFWQPGGNPDLQPEDGWSQEVGLKAYHTLFGIQNSFQLTVFSNKIDNWILWRPGSSFWSPENVQQVWARGLESSWETEKEWSWGKLNLLLRYHYTRSTIEKADETSKDNEGNQLIYTPKHTGNVNFSYQYKTFRLTWQQQFNGGVYTTTSNTSTLPSFILGNILASYQWQHKLADLTAQVQIYNITNLNYEVIEWRPMPGRNFQFGLIIKPKFNF